jgi:hypothetical protein
MRCWNLIVAFCTLVVIPLAGAEGWETAANPAIDIAGYLRVSRQALDHRETHRLSERDFIRMSREPGTVVLDARSRQKYEELHIKGAINLSFPDIAIGSLSDALPDKDARILIYCNNNFRNAEEAFPTKLPSAALNISPLISRSTITDTETSTSSGRSWTSRRRRWSSSPRRRRGDKIQRWQGTASAVNGRGPGHADP